MADTKLESVDPREFDELMAKAAGDEAARKSREVVVPPPARKLFFNENTFHPPRRRVKCIVAHFGGKAFDCPVLRTRALENEMFECILLITEVPRTITAVVSVPKSELDRAPETDIEW